MTTTRSRLSALGLLLGMFVLGAVAGGVGISMAEHRDDRPDRRGYGRDGYVERLSELLQLTEVQKDSIRGILQRSEPPMDSLWRELRPRFDSLRAEVRSAIQGQLTPDQQRVYSEMLERRDREYRERRANGRR